MKILKFLKQYKTYLFCALFVILIIWGIVAYVEYVTYEETINGYLNEIDDGVYVQTYNTFSNVPAYNSTVATICIDDKLYTISGHINIYYTKNKPSYEWTMTNVVNADTLTIYVPKGSVERLENKNIGD